MRLSGELQMLSASKCACIPISAGQREHNCLLARTPCGSHIHTIKLTWGALLIMPKSRYTRSPERVASRLPGCRMETDHAKVAFRMMAR
eukprot:1153553-Pelagomonas_calceolata.AAC.10